MIPLAPLLLASAPALAYQTSVERIAEMTISGTLAPISGADIGVVVSGGQGYGSHTDSCNPGAYSCCDYSTLGTAADAFDFVWVHEWSDPIVFSLSAATNTVIVANTLDHGPYPEEGVEYTVWGSADGDTSAFPDGWTPARLVAVYEDGFQDGGCSGQEADDGAVAVWSFGSESFEYVATHGAGSMTIFLDAAGTTWSTDADSYSDDGWQSSDIEIDAVAAPACMVRLAPAISAPSGAVVGETVVLDGSGSSPSSDIAVYSWEIGESGTIDAVGPTVEVVPDEAGDLAVTLYVVGSDGCTAAASATVHVCSADEADGDGDGATDAECGGDDCDDADATVHPGAADAWYDGVDSDCDGASDYDADADGHDSADHGGDDCDDADATVHPGAADAWYDGVDSDCDGADDYDADADGYGSAEYGGDDCDDADPAVHPGADDAPGDGVDSDCDGADGTSGADDTGGGGAGPTDTGGGGVDTGVDDGKEGGCGCTQGRTPRGGPLGAALLAGLAAALRRRQRRPASS